MKKRLRTLLAMGMLLVTSSITVYGATEENEVQQPRAAQLYCTGEVAKTVYGKNTIQFIAIRDGKMAYLLIQDIHIMYVGQRILLQD